jgi:hypothetical protein
MSVQGWPVLALCWYVLREAVAVAAVRVRQGDRERAAGLAVSPLMDRARGGITKSQVGFFDIVALPLYKSLAQVRGTSSLVAKGAWHQCGFRVRVQSETHVRQDGTANSPCWCFVLL